MISRIPMDAELLSPRPAAPRPRPRGFRAWLGRVLDRDGGKAAVWTLVAAFVLIYFWRSVFITIDAGHAGVRWSRFTGTVRGEVYGEGMAMIPPWDRMYVYPVRMQSETDSLTMLTTDGLTINMIVTTRFYPNVRNLPLLHSRIGPDYRDKIVLPEVVSSVRRTIGNRTPHEIYSENEFVLQREIFTTAREEIDSRFIILEEVLIQKMTLPARLQDAIRDKLAMEQAALAYVFRLDAERAEAARKQIEAQGIRAFEEVSGIPILRWRGLAVTEELAKSPNSKLVVVPTGSEALPVILNP
jgi:regulator of protease activity HflC (stomatin/prohibitin superfamily)